MVPNSRSACTILATVYRKTICSFNWLVIDWLSVLLNPVITKLQTTVCIRVRVQMSHGSRAKVRYLNFLRHSDTPYVSRTLRMLRT